MWRTARRVKRATRIGFALLAIVLILPALGDAANGQWKRTGECAVWAVVDGDTLSISCDGVDASRLRIAAVDTPEYAGACWAERRAAIAARIYVQRQLYAADQINVIHAGRLDRYGRLLGDVALGGGAAPATLSQRLLDSGHARPYVPGIDWCNGGAT